MEEQAALDQLDRGGVQALHAQLLVVDGDVEALPAQQVGHLARCGLCTRTKEAAWSAMNSVIEQSARTLPRPTTIRWSAVSAISDIRWLETKTVRPSAASCRARCAPGGCPRGRGR